jgi:hypothetical protein
MNASKLVSALLAGFSGLLLATAVSRAEVKVLVDHNDNEHTSAAFKFKQVPSPSATDAATKARFSIVDGQKDDNGGDLDKLHDGKLPTEQDQPAENFFFDAGTEGGRLLVDLGAITAVKQINTYSWHPSNRGPQVYKLYASDGKAEGFKDRPKCAIDPEKCGWKRLTTVDTRPKSGETGGQYGVSIFDPEGSLGSFQYLLFDVSRTEDTDDFGNTFFSEIDVVSADDKAAEATTTQPPFVVHSPDGYCTITIDTSHSPEFKEWAEGKLAPVLAAWYPKITTQLASDGYEAPKAFRVNLQPLRRGIPAATGGTTVTVDPGFVKREINREAIGAVVHEEVHVVQQYGWGRRRSEDFIRPPGWLTEGIPDYIRWFQYEPQSHGADAIFFSGRRNVNLKYDGQYRITANFLHYVVEKYDPNKTLITKLNAACRQGKYTDDLWKSATSKTILELNDEWKDATEKEIAELRAKNPQPIRVAAADPAPLSYQWRKEAAKPNTLTEGEQAAGWKLLFNGTNLDGWHNFKREGVLPGWQVKDGALVCADPRNAKDIVTAEQFDWFELQLDYNISEEGNSGIMYHVTDEGNSAWATGPEFQLEDNVKAHDPIRCGWLYGLYQPPMDEKTGKPLDATKPVGEWNHVRLVIGQDKCIHEINGVKYFEYVLGSDDFKERVAKSKFRSMPRFAKAEKGYIALQGDHGQVSFRNIKLRPLQVGG